METELWAISSLLHYTSSRLAEYHGLAYYIQLELVGPVVVGGGGVRGRGLIMYVCCVTNIHGAVWSGAGGLEPPHHRGVGGGWRMGRGTLPAAAVRSRRQGRLEVVLVVLHHRGGGGGVDGGGEEAGLLALAGGAGEGRRGER